MIDKYKVVLVTTTFSKDLLDPRVGLAVKTCHEARGTGYQLIVVDGSPCMEFKSLLREAGSKVIDQVKPGMGASRRECIIAGLASDAEVIVWLEPEKHTLVSLLESCIEPVINGTVDVVIPRRKSLESYPSYQQWSEYVANWQLGNITGRPDLDFFSGPRVMNRAAAAVMAAYSPDNERGYGDNWEILFLPLLEYMKRGWNIGSVIVDYIHPPEQLAEDDEKLRAKRDKQRNDLVGSMTSEARRLGIKSL